MPIPSMSSSNSSVIFIPLILANPISSSEYIKVFMKLFIVLKENKIYKGVGVFICVHNLVEND